MISAHAEVARSTSIVTEVSNSRAALAAALFWVLSRAGFCCIFVRRLCALAYSRWHLTDKCIGRGSAWPIHVVRRGRFLRKFKGYTVKHAQHGTQEQGLDETKGR